MKILFIHQYFCPPGSYGNNRSYEIGRYWVEAGHEVIMLTSSANFPSIHPVHQKEFHFECINGIQTYVLNVPYSHYFGFLKRIISFLKFYYYADNLITKLNKPDLIYASSTPPSVGELGKKWSKKWDIPLIFETVDVWPDVPEQMRILTNPLLLKYLHTKVEEIYKHASLIVALSPDMKQQILLHGVPAEKVIVSYNGTNPNVFFPVEKSNKIPKILYAGAVGQVNEVSELIYAAKALENSAEFILIGNGNQANKVKQLMKQLKPQTFTWHSWVSKELVSVMMANADIGVSTIANYKVLEANSANKFYDYLACGLPVVNNYEGWQKTFLGEHQCGFASPLGNRSAFIANLELLIQDKTLRTTMSRNARNAAVKYFDRKKLANELLHQISKLQT